MFAPESAWAASSARIRIDPLGDIAHGDEAVIATFQWQYLASGVGWI